MNWDADPAASGMRWRARRRQYELVAYEDGRWFVNDLNGGHPYKWAVQIAGGIERSLERAKAVALLVFAMYDS